MKLHLNVACVSQRLLPTFIHIPFLKCKFVLRSRNNLYLESWSFTTYFYLYTCQKKLTNDLQLTHGVALVEEMDHDFHFFFSFKHCKKDGRIIQKKKKNLLERDGLAKGLHEEE